MTVSPATTMFEELDIDSLDLVELRQIVEEQFGVRMAKEDLVAMTSVGDVIDFVTASTA